MLVLRPVGFPSCQSIFIPAVPGGWQKSEQSPARKPALLQPVVYFAGAGGCGGEVFSFPLHESGPGHLQKVKVVQGGVSKRHLPLWDTQCPSTSLRICSSASLLLFCICTGFWDWIFLGCQKLIPKTRLTGDTSRTACCLLPLLPSLPFASGTK